MTNNTKFDLSTAHKLLNKFSCSFSVQAVVLSLKQATNTDVFSRVVSCSTMSMKGEVHTVCYCKSGEDEYIQLLCLNRQLSSSFLVTRHLPLITFFNISFAQDKAPLQAMEEHSESTDDKGEGNII